MGGSLYGGQAVSSGQHLVGGNQLDFGQLGGSQVTNGQGLGVQNINGYAQDPWGLLVGGQGIGGFSTQNTNNFGNVGLFDQGFRNNGFGNQGGFMGQPAVGGIGSPYNQGFNGFNGGFGAPN